MVIIIPMPPNGGGGKSPPLHWTTKLGIAMAISFFPIMLICLLVTGHAQNPWFVLPAIFNLFGGIILTFASLLWDM
jgi:hypothetical protein